MSIDELKKHEGSKITFLYRGKPRPFILAAVQNEKPCECIAFCDHLIKGRFKGEEGEIRIEYNYPSKTSREWTGFWTGKLDNVISIDS
jgi:hypothetical protein